MFEPQQQLRKLSFDQEISHVLRTPNRIKYKHSEFEGWQDLKQHPLQSPQRKPIFQSQKAKFKVKPSKIKINPQSILKSPQTIIQNKENHQNDKLFNLKMIKMLDHQTLSPNSRKILTPNKIKQPNQYNKDYSSNNRLYQTPKSTYRTRRGSLNKLSATEGINKISFSQKRHKYVDDETGIDESLNDQNGFKIPLSAIVYPVLKSNGKKTLRRIERFHSFVARTVRK